VRFALTFPLNDANNGVIVVPTADPSTIAQAKSKPIHPLANITKQIANVAAELCITMVTAKPTNQNMSTDPKPIDEKRCKNANISGFFCKSGTYVLIMLRPKKSRAKPIKNSPIDFVLPFFENSIGTANAINGIAKAEMSTLKPSNEIIHVVNVVPKLAPKITAIDCDSVISPAFTKLTTSTIDADELCMSAVMKKPVINPASLLRVITDKMLRRRSPATFCRPSLIIFMP
jgi:hypothetical protein